MNREAGLVLGMKAISAGMKRKEAEAMEIAESLAPAFEGRSIEGAILGTLICLRTHIRVVGGKDSQTAFALWVLEFVANNIVAPLTEGRKK